MTTNKRMGRPPKPGNPLSHLVWPSNLKKHTGDFFDVERFNYISKWSKLLPHGTVWPDISAEEVLDALTNRVPIYMRKHDRGTSSVAIGIANTDFEEVVGFSLAFYQTLLTLKIVIASKYTNYLRSLSVGRYVHNEEVRHRLSEAAKQRWARYKHTKARFNTN